MISVTSLRRYPKLCERTSFGQNRLPLVLRLQSYLLALKLDRLRREVVTGKPVEVAASSIPNLASVELAARTVAASLVVSTVAAAAVPWASCTVVDRTAVAVEHKRAARTPKTTSFD